MGLNALDGLASIRPDLDLAIVATGVTPALFVESDAGEQRGCIGTPENTWLLQTLGNISGMPESDLLGGDSGKSEIVGALRPGDVKNAVRGSVDGQQTLLSLDVVDSDSVVVREIDSGNVASARRKGAGSDAARSSLKVELADLLAVLSVPHMDSRAWSGLASDDGLSVSADVDGEDVVSVEGLVRVLVLSDHLCLLTSIELLLTSRGVHNNTHSSNHVQSFALGGVAPIKNRENKMDVKSRWFDRALTSFAGSQKHGSRKRVPLRSLPLGLPC